MDQAIREKIFIYAFKNTKSMNYYFEIPSNWARGNKDLLMISVIFEQQITSDLEQIISALVKEFSERLKSNNEIYTAFYNDEFENFDKPYREIIENNFSLVKLWVKELYYAVVEGTKKKNEEQKIAILLNKRHIFLTLKRLSKGPIILEELKKWFNKRFSDKNFEKMIKILLDKQLIFINQIGRIDTYVLLLKEVNIERVPPVSVIEYLDEMPELTELLIQKVQEYFNQYENKNENELENDTIILYQILSDLETYNILSKLRVNFIQRDKLPNIVSKNTLNNLIEIIEFLKNNDVIEELNYNNERYIALKTDLQITTAFPEYLKKLVPREFKIKTLKLEKELEIV